MRTKVVPRPPADLEGLSAVHRALPLVPASAEDCADRLVADAGVRGRDEARRWLTFLVAVGLATERTRGFARERREVDRAALAEALESRVYGARELAGVLAAADGPLDADEAFDLFADRVPTWERRRDPGGWRDDWRERARRLLDWLVLVGRLERVDGAYRPDTT